VTGLRTSTLLADTLSSPLMVGLARVIYNPRPGESAGNLPYPGELCTYPDRAAIEAHLLDAFIPAAYRSSASRPRRGRNWTAKDVECWLSFLARHLEYTVGRPDLAWWQLARATPRSVIGLTSGLFTGLVSVLAIEIAFIVVVATSDIFDLRWFALPTVGMAAVRTKVCCNWRPCGWSPWRNRGRGRGGGLSPGYTQGTL